MKKFLLVLCVGFLVACGSADKPADNSGDASTNAPAATTAPAAQALPPHMANIKGEAFEGDVPVTMKVGETYVFTGDSKGWQVGTQNPELVKITQGGTQDTYETNPGFTAIAAGQAIITVTNPANTILTVIVTIE